MRSTASGARRSRPPERLWVPRDFSVTIGSAHPVVRPSKDAAFSGLSGWGPRRAPERPAAVGQVVLDPTSREPGRRLVPAAARIGRTCSVACVERRARHGKAWQRALPVAGSCWERLLAGCPVPGGRCRTRWDGTSQKASGAHCTQACTHDSTGSHQPTTAR